MKKKKLTYNSLALGNLKNRKKQYTLLIIGIILSMTFSSSFTFFVSSAISSAVETHNTLYGEQTYIITNTIHNDAIENVLENNFSEYGYAHILGAITTKNGEVDEGATVAWLDDTAKKLYRTTTIEGRMPTEENEIAIEENALERLGLKAKIGETLTFDYYVRDGGDNKEKPINKSFTLVGILKNKRSNLEELNGSGTCTTLPAAIVKENTQVELGGKESLFCFLLCENRKTAAESLENYIVITSENGARGSNGWSIIETGEYSYNYSISNMLGSTGPYLIILLFVSMFTFISNIGIINSFSTNLKERKRQIGLLRSVGATKRQIIKAYGRETFFLCLFSTPVSLIISIIAVKISISSLGEDFVFKPTWWVLPLSIIISILVVVLSSFIPLFSASRISPMQAIRNIELNRKMKKKNIKSQTDFNASKLLCKRNLTLYKNKQSLAAIIICFTILASIFGFSGAKNIAESYEPDPWDYNIQIENSLWGLRTLANYKAYGNGIDENDKQDILSNKYVDSVASVKTTCGFVKVPELTEFLKLCCYTNYSFEINFNNQRITQENFKEHQKFKDNFYTEKELNSITDEILPVTFMGVDDTILDGFKDAEIIGKINIDKLNSGEEIILVIPEQITACSEYLEYSDTDKSTNIFTYPETQEELISLGYEFNENYTFLTTEKLTDEFKLGENIDLGWISGDENIELEFGNYGPMPKLEDTSKNYYDSIYTTSKIGAIIYCPATLPSEILNCTSFSNFEPLILTTLDGLNKFTEDVPYNSININLNTECNDEIDAEITNLLKRINVSKSYGFIRSTYQSLEVAENDSKTLLIIVFIITVLLFVLSGSLINNTLTARIRESKKEIGTLRAVGASTKEISSSYIRQVLSVLGTGTLSGAVLFSLSYAIYYFAFISLNETPDDFILTFWETLVGIVALVISCVLNVYLKVKKEMKHSIVENIREL